MQRKVLEVIEEEKLASRYNIIKKTNLKRRTVIDILRILENKGLIKKKWYLGFYIYSPTGAEYAVYEANNEEDKLLQILREHGGITRNKISKKLGFNWKKTVKTISKLEAKGSIKKIEYNGITVYIIKNAQSSLKVIEDQNNI